MEIKRYEAITMEEALRLVKEDLGSSAIILSSRELRDGKGQFGVFGRPIVEVTAATESDVLAMRRRRSKRPATGAAVCTPARFEKLEPTSAADDDVVTLTHRVSDEPVELTQLFSGRPNPTINGSGGSSGSDPTMQPVLAELAAIKRTLVRLCDENSDTRQKFGCLPPETGLEDIDWLSQFIARHSGVLKNTGFHPNLIKLYQGMLHFGVSEMVALKLLDRVNQKLSKTKQDDPNYCRLFLTKMLTKIIKTTGPINLGDPSGRSLNPVMAAFVGPTGVGKTTTIAKLAAKFAFEQKRKVGFITIDTYRIAAVEQLKIYANIIGAPVEVVASPREMTSAITKLKRKDVIFIDTAGRSHQDPSQLQELKKFFPGNFGGDIFLTMSATTKDDDLGQIVQAYKLIPVKGVVVTKLDETRCFGPILNQIISRGIPLAYMTTGQKVPEDILTATPENAAEFILNGVQPSRNVISLDKNKKIG
ncbi:MAG: flagellar biosynthesis protein FlhF [Deltaproteobacteria bacterium]|nr:flagellar biosynthesis protein FlhF [Deltaproteobacteria bacterium]